MKNIVIILLILAATATEATYSKQRRRSIIRTDEYVETNRVRYASILLDYNEQLEKFIENYSRRVETVNLTQKCKNDLNIQVNRLLFNALNFKSALMNYITYYDDEIAECAHNNDQSTKNYAICAVKTTFTTNKFTFENRKAFKNSMETAECMIKIYYKRNLDCNYVFVDI